MKDVNRILVLSPHPDDGELGCGGTLSRWIEEEKDVYYVVFSDCCESLNPGLCKDTLIEECMNSTRNLGIQQCNLEFQDFQVRVFPEHRQKILDTLIRLKNEIRPDLVLTPSSSDTHQDHQTIHNETLRAFKKDTSIWGFEHPWNNLTFTCDIFIKLEKGHVEKKEASLACYRSQADRPYFDRDYTRAQLISRGVQISNRYAEVFESIRVIL